MWETNVYKNHEYALSARLVAQSARTTQRRKKQAPIGGIVDNFMEEVTFELHLEGLIAF